MNCMNATKYEIDMLGVGAADALLVRFFDENDKAYIILVDAGNYCNGETIAKFVKESAAAGFQNLKGHRSVGGMRASIYNAMPEEGVDKLIKFIEDFEKANS